jgi:hypothetical protein
LFNFELAVYKFSVSKSPFGKACQITKYHKQQNSQRIQEYNQRQHIITDFDHCQINPKRQNQDERHRKDA